MATIDTDNNKIEISNGNLETSSLIWLDLDINKSSNNQDLQLQLRAIINHLKTFDNAETCQKYIKQLTTDDKLVLIVNGQISQKLLSQMHQLRQISSIYVHCVNKTSIEQWTPTLIKIKTVTDHLDELISQLQSDQNNRMQVEEPLSINIFTTSSDEDQSTTGLNGQFVHSQLLIDVLLRMKSINRDNDELITFCKREYQTNPIQLNIVHEFDRDYCEERALWWYTRESFVYKMLNKALRVQNIHVLFLFRAVMRDIQRQLKNYQYESPIQVYRGQLMRKDELDRLRRSIGELVSMNSFLSTSINRQKAIQFLNRATISDDLQRILFEIDADPRVIKNKPFADISRHSAFASESEVLFMLGSIFRLYDIRRTDDSRMWIIRMTLCSDDDHVLKNLCLHLTKEYTEGGIITLRSLGMVLRKMAKYDLAEKYLLRHLNELSTDDITLGLVYQDLGLVAMDRGDEEKSIRWYQKSIETYHRTCPFDLVNIALMYINIGEYYGKRRDYDQALDSFKKSMAFFKKANDESNPKLALVFGNMGIIYRQQEQESLALAFQEKALAINLKHLPADHPDLGGSYNNIGLVHASLGNQDMALENYNRALQIKLKSLPPDHPELAMTYANIGMAYADKAQFEQGLPHLRKAEGIFRRTLPPQHPSIIKTQQIIAYVSMQSNN